MNTTFGYLLPFVLGYLHVYVEYDFTSLMLLMIQGASCSPLGCAYFGGKKLWKMWSIHLALVYHSRIYLKRVPNYVL